MGLDHDRVIVVADTCFLRTAGTDFLNALRDLHGRSYISEAHVPPATLFITTGVYSELDNQSQRHKPQYFAPAAVEAFNFINNLANLAPPYHPQFVHLAKQEIERIVTQHFRGHGTDLVLLDWALALRKWGYRRVCMVSDDLGVIAKAEHENVPIFKSENWQQMLKKRAGGLAQLF